MGALHALLGLLTALTNADVDGRVIVDRSTGSLRFVLLNAAAHFSKVRAGRSAGLGRCLRSVGQPVGQSVSQSISQSVSQSASQSVSQSVSLPQAVHISNVCMQRLRLVGCRAI
jgi:hypothetical protein